MIKVRLIRVAGVGASTPPGGAQFDSRSEALWAQGRLIASQRLRRRYVFSFQQAAKQEFQSALMQSLPISWIDRVSTPIIDSAAQTELRPPAKEIKHRRTWPFHIHSPVVISIGRNTNRTAGA